MADIVSTFKAGKLIYDFASWYGSRKTKDFEAARDEMFRDWVVELKLALDNLGAATEDNDERIRGLEDRMREPVYLRAIDILEGEASREPTKERRRMLAYAAAGWTMLELSRVQIPVWFRRLTHLPAPGYAAFLIAS